MSEPCCTCEEVIRTLAEESLYHSEEIRKLQAAVKNLSAAQRRASK